ncbi:MAG: phosphatase PAP2 family protein [Acidimicrobiales bacterium]
MRAAAAMSAAGRYSMLWMAAAGLGVLFSSDRVGFLWFEVAIVAEWVFTNGPVKLLFRRERPDNSDVRAMLPDWLHPPRSSSFPSGHSSAAAFATVIFWSWSPVAGIVCGIVALAMGASRVIIRAHHRTDVLAGFVWGAILAALALAVLGDRLPT